MNIPVQHDSAVQDPHRTTGVAQNIDINEIACDDNNDNASISTPSEPNEENSVHTAGVDDQSESDNQSPTTTQRNRTIEELDTEMDKQYGTRLRHEHDLRPRCERLTIPAKFRDETEAQLYTMSHE